MLNEKSPANNYSNPYMAALKKHQSAPAVRKEHFVPMFAFREIQMPHGADVAARCSAVCLATIQTGSLP